MNVIAALAPFAIALPPSIRSPISEPAAAQCVATTIPATGAPVQDALPHCLPAAAHP